MRAGLRSALKDAGELCVTVTFKCQMLLLLVVN